MFLLGLAAAASAVPSGSDGPAFAVALVVALVLVSAGLVSSAFHLGRPERALRAFSQWRTSWLSREACLAAATYVPAVGLGAGWWMGEPDGGWRYLGLALAAGAAATVYSTAMIYRSLAAVPRWSTGWVPAAYLALAGASGAVWLAFLASLLGSQASGLAGVAVVLLVLAGAVKGGVLAGDRQAPRGEHHRERDRARPARSRTRSRTRSRARPRGAGPRARSPPHRAQLAPAGDGLPGGAPPRAAAAGGDVGARVHPSGGPVSRRVGKQRGSGHRPRSASRPRARARGSWSNAGSSSPRRSTR